MGRLFGTDGVRGIANEKLTCELALEIGRAAAMVLSDNSRRRPIFVVGSDTRISSGMLAGEGSFFSYIASASGSGVVAVMPNCARMLPGAETECMPKRRMTARVSSRSARSAASRGARVGMWVWPVSQPPLPAM